MTPEKIEATTASWEMEMNLLMAQSISDESLIVVNFMVDGDKGKRKIRKAIQIDSITDNGIFGIINGVHHRPIDFTMDEIFTIWSQTTLTFKKDRMLDTVWHGVGNDAEGLYLWIYQEGHSYVANLWRDDTKVDEGYIRYNSLPNAMIDAVKMYKKERQRIESLPSFTR